jgi:hypothetical protein
MKTTDERYNGWVNYETWNVNLWATNEEPTYHRLVESKPFTEQTAAVLGFELFPNGTPDMDDPSDMRKVDWTEIAAAWNELS